MSGESSSRPASSLSRSDFIKIGGAGVFGAALLGVTGVGRVLAQSDPSGSGLASQYDAASQEYNVPKTLLLAMGYVSTRWNTPPSGSEGFQSGDIHGMGGYGVMALSDNPKNNTLARASTLTGLSESELKNDRSANVRGAAAVLANLQGGAGSQNLDAWYDALSGYGGSDLYANQVFQALRDGASGETESGEKLSFPPQNVADTPTLYSTAVAADYSGAQYYGAASGNYGVGRNGNSISKLVIHDMEGSWSSAINYFQNPSAQVSAHYSVRSSDGFIGQSVREKDTAYHAGYYPTNLTSVGIEHEGYSSNPGRWYTSAMYNSSAKLAAYLCNKYNIPIDRTHIIGHYQVPGCSSGYGGGSDCHTDPGSGWDWTGYLNLIRRYAGTSTGDSGAAPGTQVIDNSTAGRFSASSNWSRNTYNSQRYGADYRAATPTRRASDPARFKVNIPSRGNYTIYGRWPAASGYNSHTTFRIVTAGGVKSRVVNQRRNGGRWVNLGTFDMLAGDSWSVRITRVSGYRGYVIADAIKVVKA